MLDILEQAEQAELNAGVDPESTQTRPVILGMKGAFDHITEFKLSFGTLEEKMLVRVATQEIITAKPSIWRKEPTADRLSLCSNSELPQELLQMG